MLFLSDIFVMYIISISALLKNLFLDLLARFVCCNFTSIPVYCKYHCGGENDHGVNMNLTNDTSWRRRNTVLVFSEKEKCRIFTIVSSLEDWRYLLGLEKNAGVSKPCFWLQNSWLQFWRSQNSRSHKFLVVLILLYLCYSDRPPFFFNSGAL